MTIRPRDDESLATVCVSAAEKSSEGSCDGEISIIRGFYGKVRGVVLDPVLLLRLHNYFTW